MQVIQLSGAVSVQMNDSLSASVEVVANFAYQHMKAAVTFREHVRDLEIIHDSHDFGSHFELVQTYASACLMSTVSSLEALINELFIDPNCKLKSKFSNFDDQFWGKRGIERKAILAKYQEALKLLDLTLLDENGAVFRDAKALIDLRNSLVHFKPIWGLERPSQASVTSYLDGRYPISPFLNKSEDFVTMKSMSYGCCKWAVDTAFALIHDFDNVTRLNDDKMKCFWALES